MRVSPVLCFRLLALVLMLLAGCVEEEESQRTVGPRPQTQEQSTNNSAQDDQAEDLSYQESAEDPGPVGLPVSSCRTREFRVALDAGHSPRRSGATSARGKSEHFFNARLTQEVLVSLQSAGFQAAFRVNPEGEELSRSERTRRAAEENAQLFISLHHDSVQEHYLETWTHEEEERLYSDRYSGYSLFVNQGGKTAAASRAFAEDLGHQLRLAGHSPTLHHSEDINGERRELLVPILGVYRFDELTVLRTASFPALLMEAGVLVNRDEELLLEDARHRASLVQALVQAVHMSCTRLQNDR